ncbi:Hpt domain-containing protein [Georgenia alba]|uniref:Hpt domain-containing protein n=1 Tax=Georgenia alba TaxID=2233858 RepID=A0ABW2Q6M1_9MICO
MLSELLQERTTVARIVHEVETSAGRAQVSEVLLDPAPLRALVDDLGLEVAQVFVQRFVHQLPFRVDQLRLAVRAGDAEREYDAAHSLASASSMVGARALSWIALDWATAAVTGRRTPGLAGLVRLRRVASETLAILGGDPS